MSTLATPPLRGKDQRGFTLVEVTIIILVLVIMSTILLPQLGNYNRLARFVKVHEDIGGFCSELKKMLDETMNGGFWGDPQGRTLPIGLLAGEAGGIPAVNPSVAAAVTGPANSSWQLAVPATTSFLVQVDVPTASGDEVRFYPDSFENHIMMNTPLDMNTLVSPLATTSQYDNGRTLPTSAWAFGWHGPYFNRIDTDPWGNRYACNVFALHADRGSGSYFTSPVVCLSAGPNETIDSPFNMPYKDAPTAAASLYSGYFIGEDDIACVLSSGGPM